MIASSKGGTGKSTIACNLAVSLTKYRKKTMLIDADVNMTSSQFDQIRTENKIQPLFSCVQLGTPTINKFCATEQIQQGYDVIIIDGEGADTKTFRSGIKASDIIIVPTAPSPPDLWETSKVLERIDQEKDESVKVFGLINKKHVKALINAEVADIISLFEEKYDMKFLQEALHSRVQYGYTFGQGLSVVEQSKSVEAKIEFEELTKKLLKEI